MLAEWCSLDAGLIVSGREPGSKHFRVTGEASTLH